MSTAHLAAVANLATPTLACKALMWSLAFSADPASGIVRANIALLSVQSGMTDRSVRANLHKLANRGLIEWKPNAHRIVLTLPVQLALAL